MYAHVSFFSLMYAYVGWHVCTLVSFRFSLLLHRTVLVLPLATKVRDLPLATLFKLTPCTVGVLLLSTLFKL